MIGGCLNLQMSSIEQAIMNILWIFCSDRKSNNVLYEPFCGDKVDFHTSSHAPNRIRFAEDPGNDQSRFALLMLDRDATGSSLRKYAAVNIRTADLLGNGFDPQTVVSFYHT